MVAPLRCFNAHQCNIPFDTICAWIPSLAVRLRPSDVSSKSFLNINSFENILSSLFFVHVLDVLHDIFKSRNPDIPTLIMNTTGLLYALTILESAYRFNEFRRSSDDYTAIGTTYNLLGRYTDALKTLEKVRTPTISSLFTRATAHLGVNQIDRAWADATRALRMQSESETPERILFILANLAMTVDLPLTVGAALIERGVELQAPDIMVSAIARSLGVFRHSNDQLERISQRILSQTTVKQDYPITQATLWMHVGDRDKAAAANNLVVPRTPEEHIQKHFSIFWS